MKRFSMAFVAFAIIVESCTGAARTNRETPMTTSQSSTRTPDGGAEWNTVIVSQLPGCDGGITCTIVLVPGDPAWMQPRNTGR